MVIKNIMDIHANWKWGNILPKRNSKKAQSKLEKEMMEDEAFMKFPPVDPRTPKDPEEKKVEVTGDDKKEIYSSCIYKAKEDDSESKEKAEEIKDYEISYSRQYPMVDTDKEEKEKKNSES